MASEDYETRMKAARLRAKIDAVRKELVAIMETLSPQEAELGKHLQEARHSLTRAENEADVLYAKAAEVGDVGGVRFGVSFTEADEEE